MPGAAVWDSLSGEQLCSDSGCVAVHGQVSAGDPSVWASVWSWGLTCVTLGCRWDSVGLPPDTSGLLAWALALSAAFSGPGPPSPVCPGLPGSRGHCCRRQRGCQSKPAPVTCRKAAGGGVRERAQGRGHGRGQSWGRKGPQLGRAGLPRSGVGQGCRKGQGQWWAWGWAGVPGGVVWIRTEFGLRWGRVGAGQGAGEVAGAAGALPEVPSFSPYTQPVLSPGTPAPAPSSPHTASPGPPPARGEAGCWAGPVQPLQTLPLQPGGLRCCQSLRPAPARPFPASGPASSSSGEAARPSRPHAAPAAAAAGPPCSCPGLETDPKAAPPLSSAPTCRTPG